ncbi:MAG: hypothetical protein HYS81_04130 [Candidatus Aenigmatarchaeota archaeon]|nr:MAG: hypothetical protein HYS81_04130 [Candidatus Aenigmarchaeota archaeon]
MVKGNANPIPVKDRLTTKESLFYPSILGKTWKTTDPDVRWELNDIVNHVFPREYQERSHSHAMKLLALVLQNPKGVDKTMLTACLKEHAIPDATAYNVIIPKLVRFGLLERKREVNASNPSRGWFMILKPSLAFANHLNKLSGEWRSVVKTALIKSGELKEDQNI